MHINEHCYLCLAAIDFYGRKMSQILLKYFEGIIEHMDGSYSVENVYSSFRLKKTNKPNKKTHKGLTWAFFNDTQRYRQRKSPLIDY